MAVIKLSFQPKYYGGDRRYILKVAVQCLVQIGLLIVVMNSIRILLLRTTILEWLKYLRSGEATVHNAKWISENHMKMTYVSRCPTQNSQNRPFLGIIFGKSIKSLRMQNVSKKPRGAMHITLKKTLFLKGNAIFRVKCTYFFT